MIPYCTIWRIENGAVKQYIAEIGPSSLTSSVSQAAMRTAIGLTEIVGDLVIPATVERIDDVPMVGLAVRSDLRAPLGAHRVLLLVQGTGRSELVALEGGKSMEEASYKVFSSKARRLLSASETYIDLVGYCDFNGMLQYRLGSDDALVLVSAVSPHASDSVSAGGPALVATIEHVQKVTAADKQALLVSLATEWKSVVIEQRSEGVSATGSDYWDQPASKLRKIDSEPVTPSRVKP